MSLSESQLQSQLAHNSCNIKYLEEALADKELIKDFSSTREQYFKNIKVIKSKIAKYAKLQKALKDELKAVRENNKRGAIVEAFITQQVNKLLLEK